jgi:PAS domain-containing protein
LASHAQHIVKTSDTFRALLEAAPDAMVIVGGDGRIALVNAQTEKLFGYARDELLGNTVEMLVPARFRDRHAHHRDDYFPILKCAPCAPAWSFTEGARMVRNFPSRSA